MNNYGKIFVGCMTVSFLAQASFAFSDTIFPPVTGFDLNRYLGRWYEIARMPSSFEKELVNVTADYSLKTDGTVKVLNQGRKKTKEGETEKAIGKAKFAGDSKTGYLRVSFFWIFYGDYIIADLDPDYRWALIIGSTKLMWILAREPKLDEATYLKLVEKARSLGVETQRLYRVPQE